MIEFTATPGVMSVREERPVTPETLVGIHAVFGDGKRVSAFCYMDWETLGPSSFFMTSWMGGYPPIRPLTSYDVTSRVLIRTIFKWRWPWGDSHQKLG